MFRGPPGYHVLLLILHKYLHGPCRYHRGHRGHIRNDSNHRIHKKPCRYHLATWHTRIDTNMSRIVLTDSTIHILHDEPRIIVSRTHPGRRATQSVRLSARGRCCPNKKHNLQHETANVRRPISTSTVSQTSNNAVIM